MSWFNSFFKEFNKDSQYICSLGGLGLSGAVTDIYFFRHCYSLSWNFSENVFREQRLEAARTKVKC
jgi:hypothetical protein